MCLFCKIIKGEATSNIVKENDDFLAFHDLNPKAPIHIIVIPKIHIDSFNDVLPDTMAAMTIFIKEVAVTVGIKKSGYRVITSIGEDGDQEIYHFHWHILGGKKLHWEHSPDADAARFF